MEHKQKSNTLLYILLILTLLLVIFSIISIVFFYVFFNGRTADLERSFDLIEENVSDLGEEVEGVSDALDDIQMEMEQHNNSNEKELSEQVGTVLDPRVSSGDTCDGVPLLFTYPREWTAYCPGDSYRVDGETVFTVSDNEIDFLDESSMQVYEEIIEKQLATEGPQHPLALRYVESDDLSGVAQQFIDEAGLEGLITSELSTDLFENFPAEIYEISGLYEETIYFVQYSNYILQLRGPDSEEIEQVIASLQ